KKAPFCSPINRAGRKGRMAAGRGFAGKARPRGGVETPPRRSLAGVVLVFAAQGPVACRGGVYAARGMWRQAGDLRAAQNRTAGSRPRPTEQGWVDAAPRVSGKIKLHGRPAGRPYDLTGIGIYDFVRNFRKAVGRAS